MAQVSWSNPNPSDATSASLTNAAHIQPIDIGSIVSGIMRFRQQQALQQQEAMQNMMQGIDKGVSGAYQGYQQGQANDAANATMYGIQNPSDPYGGFQNPDVVPDYGGTSALKMLESAKSMGGFESPEQKALTAAKLDAEQALAHDRWTYPAHSGGYDDPNSPEIYTDPTGNQFRRGTNGAWIPYHPYGQQSPAQIDSITKRVGQLEDLSQTEKEANTALLKPDVHFSQEAELNRLRKILDTANGVTGQTDQAAPNTPSSSAPAKTSSDAAKPAASDIAYLKAHPEKAALFDKQYGAGASAAYLQ